MEGICRLYNTKSSLKSSHITPKFVIDYLKKTGSPYLRNYKNPNVRMQDGQKLYLLSEKAEQEFSKREKWFAESVFYKYLKGESKVIEYDENLFYFALSYLWRVLWLHFERDKELANKAFLPELKEVELEWRSFLSSHIYPRTFDKIYIFFTDRVENHNFNFSGIDLYLTRTIDVTIISNESGTFLGIYGKFLRFIFFAVIKGEIVNSDILVNPIGGTIFIPQKFEDIGMWNFLINRMETVSSMPELSSSQSEKIQNDLFKDPDGFINSDLGKSMQNDLNIKNRNKKD